MAAVVIATVATIATISSTSPGAAVFPLILSFPSKAQGALGRTLQQGEATRDIRHCAGLSINCTLLCGGPGAASRGIDETPLAALTLTLLSAQCNGYCEHPGIQGPVEAADALSGKNKS